MLFCLKLVLRTLISFFSRFFHFIKSITLFISSLIALIFYTHKMMVNLHSKHRLISILYRFGLFFLFSLEHFAFEFKILVFLQFVSLFYWLFTFYVCGFFFSNVCYSFRHLIIKQQTKLKQKQRQKKLSKIWFFIAMNIRSQQTCWNTKQFFL